MGLLACGHERALTFSATLATVKLRKTFGVEVLHCPCGAAVTGVISDNRNMLSTDAIAPLKTMELSRKTYARLGAQGAFEGLRVQLINGTVIVMSPMGTPHAFAVAKLSRILMKHAPDDVDVRVQLPLAAADDSEPEPDFALVPASHEPGADHPETALLVVEVADSSRKLDLGPKARLYAASRVPEYWVVDLVAHTLVVHRLPKAGRYTSVRRFGRGKRVTSAAVPSISVELSDFLR